MLAVAWEQKLAVEKRRAEKKMVPEEKKKVVKLMHKMPLHNQEREVQTVKGEAKSRKVGVDEEALEEKKMKEILADAIAVEGR